MFPGNSTLSLKTKWDQITDTTGRIKDRCVQQNAQANITRREGLEFANYLADSLSLLNTLTANANTNGLLEYARAQVNNPSLDLVSEYNTMRTALIAVQDWLVANFPNTAGELRVYTFDVNKRFVNINLTAPQLSAYKTQLTNLSATIT